MIVRWLREKILQDEVISVPILLQELKDISIDDRWVQKRQVPTESWLVLIPDWEHCQMHFINWLTVAVWIMEVGIDWAHCVIGSYFLLDDCLELLVVKELHLLNKVLNKCNLVHLDFHFREPAESWTKINEICDVRSTSSESYVKKKLMLTQ